MGSPQINLQLPLSGVACVSGKIFENTFSPVTFLSLKNFFD